MYDRFAECIDKFNSFTILMHNNPDGDSIASMFAMKRILERKRKRVELAIHNHIPENYKFWFDKYTNKVIMPTRKSECLIIVDTPNIEKTYGNYQSLADYVIVIDHHKTNTKFGDLNIVKVTTSTGVVIYELVKHINLRIDKQLAEYLYMSLCWDTDGFKNGFATSYVYEIAADLIHYGAVPQRVFRYLFEYRKKSEIKIQKMLFNGIQDIGRINYLKVTNADLGTVDNSDIYNFLNYIKLLDNLELFVLFVDRGNYFEIKMNNNQFIYDFLKNKYKKLYKIEINNSFEDDTNEILREIEDILNHK